MASLGHNESTGWGPGKLAAIVQMTSSNSFSFKNSCMVLIYISLEYIAKVTINTNPALVQIMAWHWTGDKPLIGGLIYWCIYASLSLNGLMKWFILQIFIHLQPQHHWRNSYHAFQKKFYNQAISLWLNMVISIEYFKYALVWSYMLFINAI